MTKLKRSDENGVLYGENLYLDEESGNFVWRERIKGQSRWRSTGTDKIGLARAQVKLFRSEASGDAPKIKTRKRFDDAFDLTLTIKSAKGAKTHTSAKTQIEGHLRPWFRSHCEFLDAFEHSYEEMWARYRNDQAELTPGRKLKHDREVLLFALKRAREKGWISKEFGKESREGKCGLHLNESTESIGRALEDEEASRLLVSSQSNESLYLQIRMALLMGMRLREIMHARWSEFDWKSGELVIGGARVKTRRGRRVPIHSSLMAELQTRKAASLGDYVFPARHTSVQGAPIDWSSPQDNNSKAFERARDDAKSTARFHDLRHTFMTNAMAEGMQPADVSKITGASLKVVLAIYHHIKGDVREKAKNLFCGKFVGIK